MRKARVIARDVDAVAAHNKTLTRATAWTSSVLMRGFFGRFKWLLFGR